MAGLKNAHIICVDPMGTDKLYFQALTFILSKYQQDVFGKIRREALVYKSSRERFAYFLKNREMFFQFLKSSDQILIEEMFTAYLTNHGNIKDRYSRREIYMKDKLLEYYKSNNSKLMVGQFGAFHANISPEKKKIFPDSIKISSFCYRLNSDSTSEMFNKVRTLLLDFINVEEKLPNGIPILANTRHVFRSDSMQSKYKFQGKFYYGKIEAICLQKKEKFVYSDLLVLDKVNSMITSRDLDSLVDEGQNKGWKFDE